MRLLLVSCSATKRHDIELLPALERYQGPTYRVIKGNRPPHLTIWIVSAEFGLIAETEKIPDYDKKLTAKHAQELAPVVSAALDDLLDRTNYQEMFINLGRLYAQTLNTSVLLPQFRL